MLFENGFSLFMIRLSQFIQVSMVKKGKGKSYKSVAIGSRFTKKVPFGMSSSLKLWHGKTGKTTGLGITPGIAKAKSVIRELVLKGGSSVKAANKTATSTVMEVLTPVLGKTAATSLLTLANNELDDAAAVGEKFQLMGKMVEEYGDYAASGLDYLSPDAARAVRQFKTLMNSNLAKESVAAIKGTYSQLRKYLKPN